MKTFIPDAGVNPEPEPYRWTKRRKAAILSALDDGQVTPAQLEQRHGISAEELASWRQAFAADGINGLRASAVRARRKELRQQALRRQRR